MALYYTLALRGTIKSLNWAVITHWRADSVDVGLSESDICSALCEAGVTFWDDVMQIQLTTETVLTKAVAEAYNDPTGFFEQATFIQGSLTDDITPTFVSKGFRQFRTNSDFRASTHRFPEVREANNVNSDWVYDVNVASANIIAISDFLGETQHGTVAGGISVVDFVPVLIRTQETTTDPVTHVKTTEFFNPHQISDVANAAFYGITSQVSRKYVIPS